ncbi:MAG: hypothetical protein J7K34_06595 [Flavobacteriaceae bacterium]|nr:hypothetical protein [Flavobacteriaceae bacterium]
MKKFIYFLILLTFTSCEKYDLEEEHLELSKAEKKSTLKGAITVTGQNNPLIDPAAVQHAVDNYDNIILSGVFDFGFNETNGGVDITRSGVILQGPATINNGAKLINITEFDDSFNYPLSIQASGVEVRELDISNDNNGIIVYVQENGKPVIIEDNSIETFWGAIVASSTSCGIKVINNDLEALFGYLGDKTLGNTEITNNNITAWVDGVNLFNFDHKLDIINNTMGSIGWDGIFIGAWQVTEETGPEWGDNAPVKIIGNSIDLVDDMYAGGILVGGSNYGINNVMVKENTITGVAGFPGLLKEPYGHNNSFINNDLTGLTTYYYPQIWTFGGHHNQYKNNRLGTVIGETGTLVWTANWHYQDNRLNTPDPVNYANHYSQNDYSQTGLPGWSDDTESIGAVLLSDILIRFSVNWEQTEEPFAMENYLNERKFPEGTDLCTQILDLSNIEGDDLVMGTNQIAGWISCEANADKSTYKKVNNRNKKFGKSLKDRYMKRRNAREKIGK